MPVPRQQPPVPRVAVVGLGAVTAQGPGADDLWEGARTGRVAIGRVEQVDLTGCSTSVGGEVRDLPDDAVRPHGGHRERALDLALVAAAEALRALPPGLVAPERLGLVLGTCNAGLLSAREWLRGQDRPEGPDPLLATLVTPGGLAEALSTAYGLLGPVLAVNTACASGANAIGLAADLIRLGRADAVLAGGTDALSDVVFAGFHSLQSLSPEPAAPYSGNRQGLSLGEGSGMLLLVRQDLAERYGLPVHVEVAGYGLSSDGFHATAPRPDGSVASRAMRAALADARLDESDIGYVNGHGTGTPKNDVAETRAIQLALGEAASSVLVSSTKSVVGHLLGAAGAVEAIVTARALVEQQAPPTAGYLRADPECDLDYVPGQSRPMSTVAAASNNFAFGGANACLVLERGAPVRADRRLGASRVVVTGTAALTPAGQGAAAAWAAYREGRLLPRLLDGVLRAGVDPDPEPYLTKRQRRRMDRISVLSVMAASQALTDAQLDADGPDRSSIGVVFGTSAGPMEAMERFVRPLLREGPAAADPGVFPNTVYNQAAGQVSMHLGLLGPTSTLSLGHASGAAAIACAADLLRLGHAEALVVVVSDVLTDAVAQAYAGTGVTSPRPGDAPGGLALADGSVALVLEREDAAVRRGAPVQAVVSGCGMASDGRRTGAADPQGRGLQRSMCEALAQAHLRPTDLGAVWLSAAGLPGIDRAERRAVDRVLGVDAGPARPQLHSPKLVLGEPMGVGGALSAAMALHGWTDADQRPVLVNSSSLGGNHFSLVLSRP